MSEVQPVVASPEAANNQAGIPVVKDNVSPPAVGASSPNQPAESPASVVNTAEANNNTTTTNNDVPQNSPEVKNNNSTMNTPHSTPVESSNTASNTPNTNANNSANNTPNNSNNNETSPVPEANAMVFEKGKYTLEELAAAKKGGEIEITMKEKYLTDDVFKNLFGMEPAEFEKLPKWKQNQMKKEHRLF